MSARPRPVTATFKPSSMRPATGIRERNYSLSSEGSTASLVSVLDHDSCDSLADQSEPEAIEDITALNKTEVDQSEVTAASQTKTDAVSPWEKWLVDKAKQGRVKQSRDLKKKEKEKYEVQLKENIKKLNLMKCEEKFKTWVEEKEIEERAKRMSQIQRRNAEQELKDDEKRRILEKSKKNYQDWLNMKKKKQKEEAKLKKEMKETEELKKKEQEHKCAQAFEEWCKEAQRRPRSAHNSFGYTSGKLTGYHDTGATPIPSFYNPVPWHPIAVPNPMPEKRRQKTKKRWNPNKYL